MYSIRQIVEGGGNEKKKKNHVNSLLAQNKISQLL